jgi:hypothetical protein
MTGDEDNRELLPLLYSIYSKAKGCQITDDIDVTGTSLSVEKLLSEEASPTFFSLDFSIHLMISI